MKQIRFTYLNKEFTLDLEKGELFGDDEIIKQQIITGINQCKKGSMGGHNTPFNLIKSDNLFGNIEQFSLAFYYGVTKTIDYPDELDKYLPYHKQTPPNLPKGLLITY